jgi:hypothetical protein
VKVGSVDVLIRETETKAGFILRRKVCPRTCTPIPWHRCEVSASQLHGMSRRAQWQYLIVTMRIAVFRSLSIQEPERRSNVVSPEHIRECVVRGDYAAKHQKIIWASNDAAYSLNSGHAVVQRVETSDHQRLDSARYGRWQRSRSD